jgi:hypothetical protein
VASNGAGWNMDESNYRAVLRNAADRAEPRDFPGD